MSNKRYVLDLQSLQTESRFRGIGRYSLNLTEAMARAAGDTDLWILLCGLVPDAVESVRSRFDQLVPQERIKVFDAPGPVKEIEARNVPRARMAEILREQFVAGLNPDLIYVTSLFEGFIDEVVTSVNATEVATPTAVTLYDLIPLLRQEQFLGEPLVRNWYFRKIQSLKRAELLLAISESARREAIDHLSVSENRVVNISCGVDPSFKPVVLSKEDKTQLLRRLGIRRPFILYSGAAEARKNLDGLIRAFGLLPGNVRERYQLVMAGRHDPGVLQHLNELARAVGLQKNDLVFAGYVANEDLIALYGLCALFVLPSFHEGFGLPLLEAMACGAAAIGSNTTSIPEVVERPDALFDPDSPSDIADKIHQVLTNENLQQELREHGLKQARKFTWQSCAKKAFHALDELAASHNRSAVTYLPSRQRPTLAYISPLPPQASGIADYSGELLPSLARHYDIDLVTDASAISDPWLVANFPIRDTVYFKLNASRYDRILYHFGNSAFHAHMFDLLRRHPGTIVLHDFFLSDILEWMEWSRSLPGYFSRELYHSHGYPALLQEAKNGRAQAVAQFPCNRSVLEGAIGVIVHSEYSKSLAEQWYGAGASRDWQKIPLCRVVHKVDREAARSRLGLKETEFVVCSFGQLTPAKLNQRLLSAWSRSELARQESCKLVFVGEVVGDEYGKALQQQISKAGMEDRAVITGFASSAQYQLYLQAADAAVQMRARSRGETSAAIFDCLGSGIPTIINAHGPAAELPHDVVIKLEDHFEDGHLACALERLYSDRDYAIQYSRRARSYICTSHSVEIVAKQYHQAIEGFWQTHVLAHEARAITELLAKGLVGDMVESDSLAVAKALAGHRPALGPRRLLLDISGTARIDLKTGIQRVARQMVTALIAEPPAGMRPEPVNDVNGTYTYARKFTLAMLNRDDPMTDEEFQSQPGDVWLGLDVSPEGVPAQKAFFEKLRAHNTQIYFLVHDILPAVRPELFPPNSVPAFRNWLDTVCQYADGLICVSQAVADQLLAWLDREPPNRLRPLSVGYSHHGAEIDKSLAQKVQSSREIPAEASAALTAMKARPSLLMVGTLEPRKGHLQVLDAFERLWAEGTEVNLVIVGHEGWHVESLVGRMNSHKQAGKRLFWLNAADDRVLSQVYGAASGLLAASEAEGFGLPLIEAARYGVPIVARDIPVFREVAGEHAYYFKNDKQPASLKEALGYWLELYAHGKAPSSREMKWLTWQESARRLMDCILGKKFYAEWRPGGKKESAGATDVRSNALLEAGLTDLA